MARACTFPSRSPGPTYPVVLESRLLRFLVIKMSIRRVNFRELLSWMLPAGGAVVASAMSE